ncbi:4Fe-4S binding protein [Candidatus Kuenenbacteria bacterium]|nr:4Fe-4S binding protein [Candidatus Kuenenbacteria bacterium]
MGHITSKSFLKLQKRLDMSAQGAPESEALFKILEILFTKDEAEKVSLLPIKPFSVETAAKRWKTSNESAKKTLNDLADKGILFDIENKGKQTYTMAPTMAGFFEFSLMRTDGKFDRKVLSELYYQYINVEKDFVDQTMDQRTSMARTLVHETSVDEKSFILDYEKASEVVDTASCHAVGTCYCRHKMEHVGKACDAPQNVCLTFNSAARTLTKHGIAKKISRKESQKILDECVDYGLVQIGDNTQKGVGWICNCCGCCCEAILAYKQIGDYERLSSSFFAEFDSKKCTGCGLCAKKCPVEAIQIKNKKAKIDLSKCLGCGVCHRFCNFKAIKIKRRGKTAFVPKDTFERCLLNAIEKGKLQNYIFDNYDLWTNELLRHLLGILLKLSPAKFLVANEQLRSRFLNALKKAGNTKIFKKLYKK